MGSRVALSHPAGPHTLYTDHMPGEPARLAEALARRMKRKVTLNKIGLGCAGIGEALGGDPLARATDFGRFVMLRRRDFLQALELGHPGSCIGLAEESLRRASGKVYRQTEALLLVTCARAYGAGGQGEKAAASLLSAEDAMLAGNDQVPSYAAASGPVSATVASHTGKTLTEMKDHRAAEKHYPTALRGRVPGTYQRGHGLTMANLGKSVAAQHRHEEAVALWSRSLDFVDGVTSDRSRKELRSIRSAATGYRRRVPGAEALAQRAAELLRARA
ncbi:tetratricopeptide repeat protein [Streptomyces sp. NPDC044571]|uniref:tetratricopeptide repeat protein n=1 Tax=Streptomyces sp. NPDC044571 TaxID=3155371 RepID=UPI0034029979